MLYREILFSANGFMRNSGVERPLYSLCMSICPSDCPCVRPYTRLSVAF